MRNYQLIHLFHGLCLTAFLFGCSKNESSPVLLVPKIISAENPELESYRQKVCNPALVSFRDAIVTDSNIRAVFNCANYDSTLESLRPLIFSDSFTDFRTNINVLTSSTETKNIRDLLSPWLEEKNGKSKIDSLLPTLSSAIKSDAFQDGLPLLESLLQAGEQEWRVILPAIADIFYNDRNPNIFLDLQDLFKAGKSKQDDRANIDAKKWIAIAKWLQQFEEDKSNAQKIVELIAEADAMQVDGFTIGEFIDELNGKGVLVSLYQSSGKLRGELINEKLNSDPDIEELQSGQNLTPQEREAKAMQKLLSGGENAPLTDLAKLVAEFNRPHPDFLPAVSRWISSHGDKINSSLYDFVATAVVRSAISKLNIESILQEIYVASGGKMQDAIDGNQFMLFLQKAFQSADFKVWLEKSLEQVNKEEFGEKNSQFLKSSQLNRLLMELYAHPAVAEFAKFVIPANKTMSASAAIGKFNNLHRRDKLQFEFLGKKQKFDTHLVDVWVLESKNSLGESIVVKFAIQLVQSFLSDFANGFENKNPGLTLSQWYFNATYSNPASTEVLAAYVFKDFNFLENFEKNKNYLRNELGSEIFPGQENAEDLHAYQMLIDNIPNIWIYIKSGYSRNSNTLTRALSEKDRGSLIKKYVGLIDNATRQGVVSKAMPILASWNRFQSENKDLFETNQIDADDIEYRHQLATGSEALRKIVNVLVRPQQSRDYASSIGQNMLRPLRTLWAESRQRQTTKFLLSLAKEVEDTPEDKLQKFLDAKLLTEQDLAEKRESYKTISDIMRKDKLPNLIKAVNGLFKDKAVKPALDFLAKKYDDGTLTDILHFVRRIFGIKG